MIKRYPLLIIIGLVICLSSHSQNFDFQREWATYYGGENTKVLDNDQDVQGNIYITGYVEGTDPFFNGFTTANVLQPLYGGGEKDGFIAKFNPDGLLIWATFFGKENIDLISGIDIHGDNLYIVGETYSENMVTQGVFQTQLLGSSDGFVAKLSLDGSLIWCTYFGGPRFDSANGLVLDENGDIYFYGKTVSITGLATPGSFQETTEIFDDNSSSDGNDFIAKFNNSGARLWCTYYGTNYVLGNTSIITGIAINDTGFYVSGFVADMGNSNSYYATPGCHQPTNSNAAGIGLDMFLSKFSFSGARLWSTYYGGPLNDRSAGSGIIDKDVHSVVCTRDEVYIAGITLSNSNIATPGSFQTSKIGHSNFIARFDINGVREWGTYLGNLENTGSYTLSNCILNLDTNGDIYACGATSYTDIASIDGYQEQPAVITFPNESANTDCYIAKMSSDGTARYFGTYYGSTNNDNGNRTLLHSNGFYIVGTTASQQSIATVGSHQENLNFFSAATLQPPTNAFIVKFTEMPLTVNESVTMNFTLYPIPNNGNFSFDLNENYVGSLLTMYDMSGKKVHSEKILSQSQEIRTTGLAQGTYLIKIEHNSGLRYERKIIIEN